MRRKNFILTVLIFLFVNILSMAVENPTTLSDGLSLVDPTYQEALKDYKPNLENIDKLFNYIEKNIKEKGRAIYYSKLDKGKSEIVISDEDNNIIYTEKMPKKLAEQTPYFEAKQIYQLKNGKTLTYSEMNTEMLEKKVKMKSETLMKTKMNKKDAIKVLGSLDNLNNPSNNIYSNIQYSKIEIYDENNNLILTMNYKNNKMIIEQQLEGNKVKMINYFDNSDSMSGRLETYINGNLVSVMQIKNSIPEGEAKIFYPSGKLLSTFYVKSNKMDGPVKTYYENGKIQGIYNIKDNVLNGEAIEYDENGNVVEKVLYKNGNIVK
ncbi:toxin-antitoxin system YwqK family antitoxin [Fusobacterium polymorphum]|uniref:toxin-antitoxin system YwqK family antitoxin n=1 Tax=Fusobacterium nucleatum subsp. polymorphum TaxID=76857 RepID=UPI001C6DD951|nr:toxin-antitoxin system YwqK family antitoxin [Fusobacterium polymorphum]QYR60536.1 toxin-antitoxin system YwqK family antitoxin [Fusobacterium polymorphum]